MHLFHVLSINNEKYYIKFVVEQSGILLQLCTGFHAVDARLYGSLTPRCTPRCGSLTLASARACGNLSTRVILRRVRAALDVAKSGAPRAGV